LKLPWFFKRIYACLCLHLFCFSCGLIISIYIDVKYVFLTLYSCHSRFANIVAIPLLVFHGTCIWRLKK
jgi:hypothetical protein